MLSFLNKILGLRNDPIKAASIAKDILKGNKYIAFDIGAAEWLPAHWEKILGALSFFAFEPDPKAARLLKEKYSSSDYQVLPIGLASTEGKKILYVPGDVSTGASLLPIRFPLTDYQSGFDEKKIAQITIETKTLRDVVQSEKIPEINIIKLDTQGTELDILKGLDSTHFKSIQAIEVEIGVPGGYVGQPSLSEYQNYLSQFGLELFDLRLAKTYLQKGNATEKMNSLFHVCANSPTISSKIWEVDAIFIRNRQSVMDGDENFLRKMIVTYSLYNYFLEAVDLIEEYFKQNKISEEVKRTLINQVVGLHNAKELKPIYLNYPFMNFLRKVFFRFSMKNAPRWYGYTYQEYP